MGACYLYGQPGGGGEKIKALSGATAPETAGENALWVQSDTPVTDYVFSPVQPESPAEGVVWLRTIGEGVNFILDKKQKLRFHLEAAYQYVDGAWRSVDVSVYAGTGWKRVVSNRIYLYNKGDQCTDLTGGWAVVNHSASNASLQATYISFGPASGYDLDYGNNYCNIHTNNKVYIPNGYTKLCARINLTGNKNYFQFGLGTGLALQGGNYKVYTELSSGTVGERTVEVDVSGYVNQNAANIVFDILLCAGQITEVWLER